MADPLVRDVLKREVDQLENRGYADNGIAAFKEAAAGFMQQGLRRHARPGHRGQPRHRLQAGPGHAARRFINPGDVTLMTVPGYPVAGTHTTLLRRRGLQPAAAAPRTTSTPTWRRIPADVRRRAKLLVINYPNSPTGATATRDFYRRVIDFARTNQIVVVQDAAHILLSYDGPPLSFLQVEGAREVGVEVHSMSKGFNMIGWRMAFVAGHPKIVQAFADVKDNCDSGQFMADPAGGRARPWSTPRSATRIREKYRRRLHEARRRPERGRLPGEDAQRHLFPLRQGAARPAPAGRSPTPRRRRSSSSPSSRSAACRGTTPAPSCASR